MREFLIQSGWQHYKTGCPCAGSPRYYKNPSFPEYKIILKCNVAVIRYYGVDKLRVNGVENLKQKMIEYGFIAEN
jgi:hypothetical protein